MENTANKICRCVVSLLERHGVRRAIVSPGSRNAPLIVALSRSQAIKSNVIVDERSAGFIALGYSSVSQEPVALVCTSGSALLNYGPAIAEAYYRKTPLIVISADRPKEWIGQDDSQTIVQYRALSNYVKRSFDIPVCHGDNDLWYANRVVNDALLASTSGRVGPVHINIQLSEPLGDLCEDSGDSSDRMFNRLIQSVRPIPQLEQSEISLLANIIVSSQKVMIIAGFMHPNSTLNSALNQLSNLSNVVVMTETIANLNGDRFVANIDAALSTIPECDIEHMVPDVVISTGGALVSRHIKQFLRKHHIIEHWHVGEVEDSVDCFMQLTKRIELCPEAFFPQLLAALPQHKLESDYAHHWETIKNRSLSLTAAFASKAQWSDFKVFATLIPLIPALWNVQYSNGTSIRYAQIFGNHKYQRCDCNRGVSGIDGSTSTAIGASMAYIPETTLLITGDMSFVYDISALMNFEISRYFKMIIINNDGGGIFRFIESTSKLDIREQMFSLPSELSHKGILEAQGFKYFEINNESQLREHFDEFANAQCPAVLEINTNGELSAQILKEFFYFTKSN